MGSFYTNIGSRWLDLGLQTLIVAVLVLASVPLVRKLEGYAPSGTRGTQWRLVVRLLVFPVAFSLVCFVLFTLLARALQH